MDCMHQLPAPAENVSVTVTDVCVLVSQLRVTGEYKKRRDIMTCQTEMPWNPV